MSLGVTQTNQQQGSSRFGKPPVVLSRTYAYLAEIKNSSPARPADRTACCRAARQCTSAPALTGVTQAPVDVEPAPRRREPVIRSRRRECAGHEVRPGHGGGVVDVQVLEVTCREERQRRRRVKETCDGVRRRGGISLPRLWSRNVRRGNV